MQMVSAGPSSRRYYRNSLHPHTNTRVSVFLFILLSALTLWCIAELVKTLLVVRRMLKYPNEPIYYDGPAPTVGQAYEANDKLLHLGVITPEEHQARVDELADQVRVDYRDLLGEK